MRTHGKKYRDAAKVRELGVGYQPRQALEAVKKAVRPGVRGRELYDISCEVFEAAGIPTQRSKAEGTIL